MFEMCQDVFDCCENGFVALSSLIQTLLRQNVVHVLGVTGQQTVLKRGNQQESWYISASAVLLTGASQLQGYGVLPVMFKKDVDCVCVAYLPSVSQNDEH